MSQEIAETANEALIRVSGCKLRISVLQFDTVNWCMQLILDTTAGNVNLEDNLGLRIESTTRYFTTTGETPAHEKDT